MNKTIKPRGLFLGILIIVALAAFEIFNFETTFFALGDLLGKESLLLPIPLAAILAFAFCTVDFTGIAKLFSQGKEGNKGVWYLFGLWLLAATMNAMLTWWALSVLMAGSIHQASNIVSSQTLLRVVPIFLAIMVWLVRVLIIGTIAIAGNDIFSDVTEKQPNTKPQLDLSITAAERNAKIRNPSFRERLRKIFRGNDSVVANA